uniref:TolC family protein n=1 Tax=Meloidogyne hapla TaxID=6305 RepID=A0A1I8AYK5_MELHA
MVNCSSNISLDFKNLNMWAGMVTTEELTKALEQNNKLIKLNKKFLVNATGELKENLLVEKTRLDEQKNQLFYLYQELINKDQNRIIDFQNSMQVFFISK